MAVVEKTDPLIAAQIRNANIPPRLAFGGPADEEKVSDIMHSATPQGVLIKYFNGFMQGKFIVTQDPVKTIEIRDTVGKGLWLNSKDDRGGFYATTLLQTALLARVIRTGLYIKVIDLLDSEAPDGERLGDRRWVDLMIIEGVGTHHQSASGWSDTVISGVLSRRYDRGLPTIVTTPIARSLSGLPDDYWVKSAFAEVTWTKE